MGVGFGGSGKLGKSGRRVGTRNGSKTSQNKEHPMTFPEATDLAAHAQEIFPKTTDALAVVLRDLLYPFPDAKFARGLLNRLATETTILPTPLIKAELQAELRRRGETAEAYAKAQEKVQDREAERQRDVVEAFVADFSDDELEELKPKALEVLAQKLTPDALAFVAKLKPRKSVLLKTAIFKALRPTAA